MKFESEPRNSVNSMNRRGLLAYALVGGGSAAGIFLAGNNESNRLKSVPQQNPIGQDGQSTSESRAINTIEESVAFNAFQITCGSILTHMGINVGNAELEQVMSNNSQSISRRSFLHVGLRMTESILLTPMREEFLFRAIPDALLNDNRGKIRWDIGFLTSVLFAAIHNYPKDPKNGKRTLNLQRIPLLQFNGGMFLWKQLREKGIDHAVLAHSAINFSLSPLVILKSVGESAVMSVFNGE